MSATGAIAANAPSLAALNALRSMQTFEDKTRGTMDALAYSASVGVTTDVDMGAFVIPGLPDIQDSFVFDGLASADPFRMYDAVLALHREKKMTARLRIFFLSMDTQPSIPLLSERLRNAFDGLGDDMLRDLRHRRVRDGLAAVRESDAAAQLRSRAAIGGEAGLAFSAAQPVAGRRSTHRRRRSKR